jgi:hypothetical protein
MPRKLRIEKNGFYHIVNRGVAKANISQNIGEYKWAMSSNNVKLEMLHFELIEATDFNNSFTGKEQEVLDKLYNSKFELQPLDNYCCVVML